MGQYANIKYSKFQRGILRWLGNQKNIKVKCGGKHVIKICYDFADRPFTVPKIGNEIDKNIIADLQKKLAQWGVCTREQFDNRI